MQQQLKIAEPAQKPAVLPARFDGFALVETFGGSEATLDRDLVGYRIQGSPTSAQRHRALAQVEEYLAPAHPDEVEALLGALKLTTKAKDMHDDDVMAQIGIYADKLCTFPAAAVRHVLETQADHSMWWPAWAELRERLEIYARPARLMRDALSDEKTESAPVRARATNKKPQPSPEDIERCMCEAAKDILLGKPNPMGEVMARHLIEKGYLAQCMMTGYIAGPLLEPALREQASTIIAGDETPLPKVEKLLVDMDYLTRTADGYAAGPKLEGA